MSSFRSSGRTRAGRGWVRKTVEAAPSLADAASIPFPAFYSSALSMNKITIGSGSLLVRHCQPVVCARQG